MKKQLLFKMLLVAVLLTVGTNVWADAEIPVYNSSTGLYELNAVSYVKKTYSFADYTFANNSSDTSFPAGFTGSNVDRYKNSILKDGTKAIAGSPIEITFRNMESKDNAYYYFYAGIGMQVNKQVTIYLAGSNASTIAVLNYKVGAASDKPTVADATLQTEVKTGLLPSFDLKDKDTYYYLYESVDVYNSVSTETIDGIAPAADGYYYKDGARYTRTTYDFRHYTRYGSYSSGSPAGFSVATSTNRYQVSYNSDKTDIPTGLTYGRTDNKTAYVVFCDTYGMQANGNSTLSVTTKDCNTIAYLFHKVGNTSEVVTEATAPEVFERAAGGSLSFTLNNKNGDEPWLYTRMEVFQMVSQSATLGSNGYATFAFPYPLDLTTANMPTGLTAYKAAVSGSTVTFTELNQTVPANTGILLQGEASETYNIPVVASGTEVTENEFLVNTGGTTFAGDNDYYYFGLKKNTLTFGTFVPSSVAIPASKAYLKVLKSNIDAGARLNISFGDDNTTGVADVRSKMADVRGGYYNLSGQRVDQPQKGLYIVNGKKVIVK